MNVDINFLPLLRRIGHTAKSQPEVVVRHGHPLTGRAKDSANPKPLNLLSYRKADDADIRNRIGQPTA